MANIVSDFISMFDSNKSDEKKDSWFNGSQETPALYQGQKFKKYQRKIKKHLEKDIDKVNSREGFEINQSEGQNLTKETQHVLSSTNISHKQTGMNALQEEYNKTVHEYESILKQFTGIANNYLNRVNPNNPYLGKNIQIGKNIMYVTEQGVAKLYPNANVMKNTSGQNGCPPISQIINTNLPWSKSYALPGATIPTKYPLITGTPMTEGQSCGNEGSNVFVNQMVNNPTSTYTGCYADNTTAPLMTFVGGTPSTSGDSNGNYTFEQCMTAAVNGGYQYFALQNVNASTSQGYCAVTNNQKKATSLGESLIPSNKVPLWASNTSSGEGAGEGALASLTVTGALNVVNSSGAAIFNTPNADATPGNYLGCYGDNPNRAMPLYNGGTYEYNLQTCQQIAQQNGATYFGLQNSASGQNAQCTFSSDWGQTSQYGVAGNCTNNGGSWSGGAWSNAVYNTTLPQSNYFLILQDNGDLSIYRGTSPTDNQGLIWTATTSGPPQDANPNYVASKGKYAQNWIPSGATLAPGDFVGSNSGNMVLIMQTDGNLVLYTFTMVSNCQKMSDGNMGGGVGGNALNTVSTKGISKDIGKLAYIDQNAELHPYPSSNAKYTRSYTEFTGIDSPGNDIPNAAYGNSSVQKCESTCNALKDCTGFTFSNNNVCTPKNSVSFPNQASQLNPSVNLYMKNSVPETHPVGVSFQTNEIDTITYNNYTNGGALGKIYGLPAALPYTQQKRLEQLQDRMNLLSKQITDTNSMLNKDNSVVTLQTLKNMSGLNHYVKNMVNTKNKINDLSDNNMNNIVEDSDITVLQQNYSYLFWSILATGTVLVSMNVLKQ